MQNMLVLREAAITELPSIAEHWMAMFEEVGKHSEREFTPDWRSRFVEHFAPEIAKGSAAYFIAADGERIVATAGALVTSGYPSDVHGIRNGYIFGVRVEPAYRGQGLAMRLTEAAIAFLRRRRARKIRLHASPYGRPIYEKLGFTPTNEMQLDGYSES